MKKKILILGAIGLMVLSSYSQTLVTARGAYNAYSDGTTSLINSYHGSNGYNSYAPTTPAASIILTFELPTLTAAQVLGSFTLNLQSDYPSGGTQSTDVYGLGTRSSSTALGSDYYIGTNDTRAGTTLLTSGIFTTGTTATLTPLSTGDISSYVNSLYTNGTPSQQYLVLRLSTTYLNDSSTPYDFHSFGTESQLGFNADLGSVGSNWAVPYIAYSVVAAVPEPSTYLMSVMGFIGLVLVLRSKREVQPR